MTELSPVAIMTPLHDEVKGSCGFVVPNAYAKIVDLETDKNLGPGKRGELCIKGPLVRSHIVHMSCCFRINCINFLQVMKGYLNNPEATKSTITSDGWLHSGDIAYYDEAGHFFIVDRLKELIKVKGFQVR